MVDFKVELPNGCVERVRRVAPIQNRRAAEQYEQDLKAEMLAGPKPAPPAEVPLFRDFAKSFMATYAPANNKPSEVSTKQGVLDNHLLPEFGHLRLDAIRMEQIEAFKKTKLDEKLAKKTVNNYLTILRRILVVAAEWGKLASVPHVKWLKAPEPEFDFLDFDEARRLLAAVDSQWQVMITIALRCGLRQGELLGLRWEDIDLVSGRLMVRQSIVRGVVGTPKSGKKREVPLSDEALAALKSHRHLRGELVFCAADGKPLTKGDCKWPLWNACKRAGLRRVGWHVLRHTFASHLAMRGVPLKAIQELLGHATIEMTMRYAHLSPDVRRDAVRLLDGHGQGTHRAHGTSGE